MLVLRVLLLGLLTRIHHNMPVMLVHGKNNTILFSSLNRDLGHGNHVRGNGAHRCLGDRRINRVPRCGVVRAFTCPTQGTIGAMCIQDCVVSWRELKPQFKISLHLVAARIHKWGVVPVVNERLDPIFPAPTACH